MSDALLLTADAAEPARSPGAGASRVPGERRPRCFALVPCGGTGSRAGAGVPKQYRLVAGRPVLAHTLAALAATPRIDGVLVVIAPGDSAFAGPHPGLPGGFGGIFKPPAQYSIENDATFFVQRCAGQSRAETVFNGLNWLLAHGGAQRHDWVLVHDAARCLITPQAIDRLLDACLPDTVGGLLALPLPDTLKVAHQGRVAATVDRSDKWLAQTPQLFRLGLLQTALGLAAPQGFEGITDEASAVERQGHAPLLVVGSAHNVKLTYPEDFALADALLRSRAAPGPDTLAP
jgi:2-C-methyl-D-erythritol 4-phosphate cytidylyltransferase